MRRFTLVLAVTTLISCGGVNGTDATVTTGATAPAPAKSGDYPRAIYGDGGVR